jgi:hypothetical protein
VCEKCTEAVQELFPDLTDEHQGAILMNHTGFPYVSAEDTRRQLQEYKDGNCKCPDCDPEHDAKIMAEAQERREVAEEDLEPCPKGCFGYDRPKDGWICVYPDCTTEQLGSDE